MRFLDAPAALDSADTMAEPGIIFAAGGTGGHLFPAIAVIEELRRNRSDLRLLHIGTGRPFEVRASEAAGLRSEPLPTRSPSTAWRSPWTFVRDNWRALRRAKELLREFQPQLVVGCGGYTSVPVVWAAWRLGIPIVLLEQNVLPGRATRRLSRFASVVCLPSDECRQYLPNTIRTAVTGNPVRRDIAKLCERPIISESPSLLVLGGSLGSTTINTSIIEMIASHVDAFSGLRILHQTGERDCNRVQSEYQRRCGGGNLQVVVQPFFPNMAELLRESPVVISRSGATTLAELACAGTAAVFVPYGAAKDDHQTVNAKWLHERGAARLVPEGDQLTHRLAAAVLPLLAHRQERETMQENIRSVALPSAAANVCDVLFPLLI